MKKLVLFIVLLSFILSFVAHAEEKAPEFEKKAISLYYDVPDQILMCQNKSESIEKGKVEFEKMLVKYYKKRFNILHVNRVPKFENSIAYNWNKDIIFKVEQTTMPIVVEIKLLGNGVATDTYQNAFGAQKSVNIITTRLLLNEWLGNNIERSFCLRSYGTQEYRPKSMAFMGNIIVNNMDSRVLTKNCVEWYIRDVNMFNPPNKYTYPVYYATYFSAYKGDYAQYMANMRKLNMNVECI